MSEHRLPQQRGIGLGAFLLIAWAGLLLLTCTGAQESITVRSDWVLEMEGLAFNRKVIAVPAGKEVVITLKNRDTYSHGFTVYASAEAKQVILAGIEVPAHTIKEYHFTAPAQPGRYHFQSDYYAHKMKGTFIVSTKEQVRLK